jgi:hypothetical protein
MFEISHAARPPLQGSSPRFAGLAASLPPGPKTGLCRKNHSIWDSNISPRPRKNGSFELHYLLQSEKIFLHVDVKERTSFLSQEQRLQ